MKNGKHLELKLTKGALFFNVTEKLRSDEKFEIKTSTMTAGIKGTSGIVYYDESDNNRETIAITDGAVEISATNPETGETKTARVEGGQQLKVYLTSDVGNSISFLLEDICEEDLSIFSLGIIAENDELISRICDYTGWDPDKLKKVLKDLSGNGGNPGESKPGESNPGTSKPTDALPTKPSDTEPGDTNPPTTTVGKNPKKKPSSKSSKRSVKRSSKKSSKKKSSTKKSSSSSYHSVISRESTTR